MSVTAGVVDQPGKLSRYNLSPEINFTFALEAREIAILDALATQLRAQSGLLAFLSATA